MTVRTKVMQGLRTTGSSGLEDQGIRNIDAAHRNLDAAALLEHAIERREGRLAANGDFVVRTGQFYGAFAQGQVRGQK